MSILPSKEQRIHNRFKHQIRKLAFKQYDGFVKMCESNAKFLGTERITLKSLDMFIDMAKVTSEDLSAASLDRIDKFNNTLTIFKKTCKIQSEETLKDKRISINEIKHFVKKFKDAFIEAQDSDVVTKTK